MVVEASTARRLMTSKRKGYLFVLVAILIFTLQDATSKHMGGLYPPVFITMIRYWAFAAFVLILAARSSGGLKAAVTTKHPVLQIVRGLLLVSQIVLVIASFASVGLAHSQAIFSVGPIFVALLSIVILGERVGWRRWTAIIVGLIGVIVILNPAGDESFSLLIVPVSSALIFAFYVVTTRLVSREDTAMTSFFYTGAAGAVAITLIGPFYWTWFAPVDWLWMALLCVTGTSSHFFLIKAYEYLDASEVQPLTYLQLVFASIIGVSVFGEVLSINMIVGAVIVVAAGIFTVWRESVVARRAGAAGTHPRA
ncbi:Permease of the drug/metabolite transporter (DMT) superfamily [Rhizobium sp. NFR03]|nr:Permease of the drug/metabolite transporter (DMT) superfamily [Rhizobium sp. NFR03]